MGLINFLIPCGKTKETTGLETWIVEWSCVVGSNSLFPTEKRSFQAFVSYEAAVEFKKAIEQAHKLLGNTFRTDAMIKKQNTGL